MIEPYFIAFGTILCLSIIVLSMISTYAFHASVDHGEIWASVAAIVLYGVVAGLSLRTSTYWDRGVQHFRDPDPDLFFVWSAIYIGIVIAIVVAGIGHIRHKAKHDKYLEKMRQRSKKKITWNDT